MKPLLLFPAHTLLLLAFMSAGTGFASLQRPAFPVPPDLRNPFGVGGKTIVTTVVTSLAHPVDEAVAVVRTWKVEGYVSDPSSPARSSAVIGGRTWRIGVPIPPGELGVAARLRLVGVSAGGAEVEVSAAGQSQTLVLPFSQP
jgi:hypothetical protein